MFHSELFSMANPLTHNVQGSRNSKVNKRQGREGQVTSEIAVIIEDKLYFLLKSWNQHWTFGHWIWTCKECKVLVGRRIVESFSESSPQPSNSTLVTRLLFYFFPEWVNVYVSCLEMKVFKYAFNLNCF